jgi:hypothetical protein
MGDVDRARRRNRVQVLACDLAVPESVIAPGGKEGAVALVGGKEFLQAGQVGGAPVGRGDLPPRQVPGFRRDPDGVQQHGAEERVHVRVDKARQHNLVGQRVVDCVRVQVEPGAEGLQRPHFEDAPVAHCHRGGCRQAGIHRDNLLGRVNGDRPVRRRVHTAISLTHISWILSGIGLSHAKAQSRQVFLFASLRLCVRFPIANQDDFVVAAAALAAACFCLAS